MTGNRDLLLSSSRVVLPDGVRAATVRVREGTIVDVGPRAPSNALDLGEIALLPGLVDTHVHVNEPGRTDWEGFETATRAAAAGGVTTIVDMPLNSSPVTTTVAALQAKDDAAAGRCFVDYGFWGGVVPGNAAELGPLLDAGVLGFKCFLCPSGIDEFPPVSVVDLSRAMRQLAVRRAVLLAHAEDPALLDAAASGGTRVRSYARYLGSRPPEAERSAIDLLVTLCRETRCRIHVVHLSSGLGLAAVTAARAAGVPISAETCPHYLTMRAEDIPDGATLYKCAPPVRGSLERESLWQGLGDGDIDVVVSDHSPCPPSMKLLESGDLFRAWGGIASLQLGLPLVWTAATQRGHGLDRVVAWMSAAPARLAGIDDRKGRIAPGHDADLVAFDPDGELHVDARELHHRHPQTPYDGARLRGRVLGTWVRGVQVHDGSRVERRATGRRMEPRR